MKKNVIQHIDAQVSYFEKTAYQERFAWQTTDPFVISHEKETLQPLIDRLGEQSRSKGALNVLESGCGEGANLALLQQDNYLKEKVHFYGIDPCQSAVDFALDQGVGEILRGDGLQLPWPDEYFDLSFCRDVLHHLENAEQQKAFLQELLRVTKKSGSVFAIEPNANNICIFFQSVLIPEERYVRHTKEKDVIRLLRDALVIPRAPSALWRMLWNYRTPLFIRMIFQKPIKAILTVWDKIARFSPTFFWSYRVYHWEK